jgi:hypothetical protein
METLIFSKAQFSNALEYETVFFKPSGFGENGPATPYEGSPNEERDQLWEDLSSGKVFLFV